MWATVASTLVGAVVTFAAVWLFYVRASKELRQEAARLHKLTVLLLRGMEKAGLAGVHAGRDR
jgi:hypothetical protein